MKTVMMNILSILFSIHVHIQSAFAAKKIFSALKDKSKND